MSTDVQASKYFKTLLQYHIGFIFKPLTHNAFTPHVDSVKPTLSLSDKAKFRFKFDVELHNAVDAIQRARSDVIHQSTMH